MCLTFPCATLYRPESFFTPTAAAIYDYTLDDRHKAFWRSVRWDKKAAAMQRHGDGQTCGECQSLAGPHRQHRRPSRQSRKTKYHKKLNTESLKLENNAGQCRQLMQSSINSKFSHSRLYILWQEQTVWNRTSYTVSERITRMLLTITSTIINQFWQFLAQTILRKYAINYYYYTHLTASFPGQPG